MFTFNLDVKSELSINTNQNVLHPLYQKSTFMFAFLKSTYIFISHIIKEDLGQHVQSDLAKFPAQMSDDQR